GAFFMQLLLLHLEEPAAQDAQRPVVVFVLAALVLAFDFESGGDVPDAHGAFGLVDVLAAGAPGTHAFPLDVLVANVDLHLVGFGQNGHRGRRGVNAALRLGFGDALHAMAAAFIAQELIGVITRHAEDHFLVASLFAATERDVFDFPALVAGVVRVHV